MSRFPSRYFAAVAVVFLLVVSGSLLGQPGPTPSPGPTAGAGPWSSAHPLWFDLNGDGTPQSNEMTGSPVLMTQGCTQVTGYPAVIGSSASPCMDVYEDDGIGGSIRRPNGMIQELYTNADGTVFTFTQGFEMPPPSRKGTRAKAIAAAAEGIGQLLDVNRDGIYDSLQVVGTGPSAGTVPETRMSLVPKDVTGDGRPDYITVPWTTSGAGMLGVSTGSTPQFYFPMTDTNQDGWPDTITVQVAGGGLTTAAGPPLSGPALANGPPIPSTSTLGLFVFAAAVVALGVKLLRGTIVAS